jgi:hypothetical protein
MDWLIEANTLEKCAVFVFRAEVMSQDSEKPYICKVAGGYLKEKGQLRPNRTSSESSLPRKS